MAEDIVDEVVTKYKPLLYAILRNGFELYKDLNANDDYFSQIAITKKKMLDAYCSEGFTREEALLLILDRESTNANLTESLSSALKNQV